jgi:hypothetical protein
MIIFGAQLCVNILFNVTFRLYLDLILNFQIILYYITQFVHK